MRVVVGIVVKEKDVLLIRRKLAEPGLDICFPGGKVETGQTEEEAVELEVLQETNVKSKVVKKLGEKPHPTNSDITLSYFYCEYVSSEPKVCEPDKHSDVFFKNSDEACEIIGRDLTPFVKDFLLTL
jgi:8-oxo-dGTP diphosphatase